MNLDDFYNFSAHSHPPSLVLVSVFFLFHCVYILNYFFYIATIIVLKGTFTTNSAVGVTVITPSYIQVLADTTSNPIHNYFYPIPRWKLPKMPLDATLQIIDKRGYMQNWSLGGRGSSLRPMHLEPTDSDWGLRCHVSWALVACKGAPAWNSRTRTRLASPARDSERKKATNKIKLEPWFEDCWMC